MGGSRVPFCGPVRGEATARMLEGDIAEEKDGGAMLLTTQGQRDMRKGAFS